ncbi:GtrA family protein [Metabacillus fastidiosus]|uniref:GtrA family protein n=1 Tax=Metabacillus fastidiosus TaxID=1458 RepID=UPI003AEFACA1
MILRKQIFSKFIKYSLVGCISTFIYFLSVFILVESFNKDPLYASVISFIFMTLISFLLNRKYTFGSTFSKGKLFRFLIVSLAGFILNFLIMYLVIRVFSFHYSIGELITTLIIPLINFTLNNYWTFK